MKRGTPEHPKMKKLARLLGIPRGVAVGALESLWHWTAKFCPLGDAGRFEDDDIAEACDIGVQADKLIPALVESKWLDRSPDPAVRLIVHDWPDHCEDSVHMSLARGGGFFADGSTPSFKRFSKKDQEELEAKYAEILKTRVRAVHTACAQEAHAVHTDLHCLSLSLGLSPSQSQEGSCGEPGEAPDSPPPSPTPNPKKEKPRAPRPEDGAVEFPIVGKSEFRSWWVCAPKLAEYRESFPALDIDAQIRLARQWCIDNKAKRKTESGMPAFLNRWLTNAQNQGGVGRGPPTNGYHEKPGYSDARRKDLEDSTAEAIRLATKGSS